MNTESYSNMSSAYIMVGLLIFTRRNVYLCYTTQRAVLHQQYIYVEQMRRKLCAAKCKAALCTAADF